ncbi:MAG: cell wall hydrolase [Paracoccus sp. (in: a-proteobacteria)]|nr:cell wall hydrolase [Paracoccus sp. (in: a-proteobacteria)]
MQKLTKKLATLSLCALMALPVISAPQRAEASNAQACLAEALYFEARGEGARGQRAVGEVILNRVDSRQFPSTVCGVVNQRGQFTYRRGRPMSNAAARARSHQIAAELLAGAPRELTGGATYFHATSVRPSWSRRFVRTTQIGAHVFYRPGQRVASN